MTEPLTADGFLAAMNKVAETNQTPDLATFRAMEAYDSNVLWRLGPGHAANLLDLALERIDEQDTQLAALTAMNQNSLNKIIALSAQLETARRDALTDAAKAFAESEPEGSYASTPEQVTRWLREYAGEATTDE